MIRLASIASGIDLAWNMRLSELLVIIWTLLTHSPLGLNELTKATADKSIFNIQGAVSIRKTVLPGMAIPMLKIRRPNGRLIFNMEIAIRR